MADDGELEVAAALLRRGRDIPDIRTAVTRFREGGPLTKPRLVLSLDD